MSSSIDERIVDMQFNNGEFEKGIKESLKSLDTLKKGLDLDKSAKSLNNLEKIISSVDFSGLTKGIETISSRFTTMGIAGMRAIQNITDKVMAMSERMVKSVTIDQIGAGFSKYAQKSEAVQTIMSATGKSVDEVEKVLARLNQYTDETSFNFVEMTTTIGKFVSNGIDLEVAERAMEGIGNEASLAGASIQNADHAMYNFAQALAAGKVQLMDWKSIENANMATAQFKETIIETAIELGTLKKVSAGVGKTAKGTEVDFRKFNTTLSEGWFTSEVLTATLEKYADTSTELGQKGKEAAKAAITFGQAIDSVKDAVSTGWMNTFQLLFGNFEEAKALWTGFADGLIEVTDIFTSARNKLLEGWRDYNGEDGRAILLDGLVEIYEVLSDIFTMAGMVVKEFFPPITAENLMKISKGVKEFADKMKSALYLTRSLVGGSTSLFSGDLELNIGGNAFTKLEEFREELGKGSKGAEVKKLQERLMKLGFSLDKFGADGIFGSETQKALKEFQKSVGITESGLYDLETHLAIGKALGESFMEAEGPLATVESYVSGMSDGMASLRDILRGVFSIIDIGRRGISLFGKAIKQVASMFKPLGDFLIKFTSMMGRCVTAWHDNVIASGFFDNALDKITTKLGPFGEKIAKVAEWLENLFGVNEGINNFEELFDHMKDVLGKNPKFMAAFRTLRDIVLWVSNLKSAISDFFSSIFGGESGVAQIEASADGIKGVFEKVGSVIEWIKENVLSKFSSPFPSGEGGGAAPSPLDILADIGEKFKEITEKFKDVDIGQIALAIVSAIAVIKLIKTLTAPSRFMADVAAIPGAVGDFLEGMTGAVKRFGKDTIGTTMLKIAGAIGILAGAITLLTMLDQDKMWNAVGALAAVSALMVGVNVALNKFGSLKVRQSTSMVLIAASLVEAALALRILGDLEFESMLHGILGLGLILTEMIVFSRLANASLANGFTFSQIGDMLNKVSVALSALSSLDDAGLERGLKGLGILLAELALYSKIVGDSKLQTGMFAMAGFGIAVFMLTVSLKQLAKLDGEALAKGLAGLGGVLLELGVFMRIVSGTSSKNGIFKMAAIGVAVLLLTMSLKKLSDLSWKGIGKGLVGLFGIFTELMLFLKLTSGSKSTAGFMKLIGIGLAITLLVKALKTLADLDFRQIAKGVAALGVLMLEIAAFMKLTRRGGFGAFASGVGLMAMAEAILLFTSALKKLSNMSVGAIAKGLIALKLMLMELSSFVKKISKTGGFKTIGTSLTLVGLGLSINMIVMALKSLSKLKPRKIAKGLVGVELLLLGLGRFLKKLNGLKISSVGMVSSLIGLSALLIAFAASLTIIGEVPFMSILAFGASFALFATSLSEALNTFSKVNFKAVLGTVAKFGTLAAGVTGVIVAINSILGAINEFTNGGFAELMSQGGNVLGSAIGGFISGIMSAFKTDGASSGQGKSIVEKFSDFLTDLEGVGPKLTSVFDSFKPFLDKVGSVDESVYNGMQTLVSSMLLMTGEGVLEDLSKLFTTENKGGLALFVEAMSELGPKLNEIATAGSMISDGADKEIAKFTKPMESLMEVAKSVAIADLSGILVNLGNMLTGKDNLVGFIDSVATIPDRLNRLATAGDELDGSVSEGIAKFSGPLSSLASLCGAVNTINWGEAIAGLADYIGQRDMLSGFIDGLIEVAPKLVTLTSGEMTADSAKLSSFADSMRAMSGIVGAVVEVSWGEALAGLADFVSGRDNLSDFLDSMIESAPKFSSLSNSLSGVDEKSAEKISSMASILGSLGEAASKIPGEGGLLQKIFGETNYENFGAGMTALANGLNDYAAALTNVGSLSGDEDPTIVVQKLADLESSLTAHGGVAQWFSGEKDLGVFGERLSTLGTQFASFSTDISNLDLSSMDAFIERLGSLVNLSNSQMYNDSRAAYTKIEEFVGYMSSGVSTLVPELIAIGDAMAAGVQAGLVFSSSFNGRAVGASMAQKVLSGVKSYVSQFNAVGKLMSLGLANGIASGRSLVVTAATNVVGAAIAAAKLKALIQSPSRAFAELGMYMDLGLAKGLKDYSRVAETAASDVTTSTLSSTRDALNRVFALVNEGVDINPVITPVLDLRNVTSGIGTLHGMIGRNISNARIGLSGLTGETFTSSSSPDVVNALGVLNSRVNELAEAMTHLQVVTETGALVGAIAPEMDRKLGQRTTQKRRLG